MNLKIPSMEGEKGLLISVITVCFNNADGLEETIQSVLRQTYSEIEFLIIDGGSTDRTSEILEKYRDSLDVVISEPDQGIYDAMNKGVQKAKGEWLIFMNSGDRFYSDSSISEVFATNSYSGFAVVYGDWEVRYSSGKKRQVNAGSATHLWKGSQFCHQAAFISSRTHKQFLYNLNNPIAADFEFFYGLYLNGSRFKKTKVRIATIAAGGVSDTKRHEVILAWKNTVGSNLKSNLYFSYRMIREALVQKLKQLKK